MTPEERATFIEEIHKAVLDNIRQDQKPDRLLKWLPLIVIAIGGIGGFFTLQNRVANLETSNTKIETTYISRSEFELHKAALTKADMDAIDRLVRIETKVDAIANKLNKW